MVRALLLLIISASAWALSPEEIADSISGNGGTRLHYQFFGGPVNGETYRKFYLSRIAETREGDCGNGIACYKLNHPGIMWTDQKNLRHLRKRSPKLYLPLFIHEAWHADPANPSYHVYCPTTDEFRISIGGGRDLRGQYACDDVYNGSYGTDVVVFANLAAYCLSCTAGEKAEAKRLARHYLRRITSPEAKAILMKDVGRIISP